MPANAPKPNSTPARTPGARPTPAGSAFSYVDVRQTFVVLRGHLLPALAVVIVVCTLVAWQQMRQPKLYTSQATLLVEGGDRIVDTKQVVDQAFDTELQIATRLEQIRSADVVKRVTASLTPAERALILAPYYSESPPVHDDLAVENIVRTSSTVDRKGRTMLIAITVIHRDPQAAALIANRYAEQIIGFLYDRATAGNDAALTFLRKQGDDLKKKVETEEKDLQEYRQKYNLVSLEGTQNIVVDRLKALNSGATAAKLARLSVEGRLNQAESLLQNSQNVAQLASIAEFSALTNVQGKIDELTEKRAVLAQRYGPHHPLMEQNQREIEAVQRLRTEQIQAAMADLRNQRDKAVTAEKQLNDQLASAEQDALRLDRIGVDYNVLRRQVETDTNTYAQILSRLNEATITAQLQGVKIKISEAAVPAGVPFSPNPRKAIMITAALGLVILIGYPFTVEMLFARVRNWSDVESYLGATLLAEVGSVTRIGEGDRPHLVEKDQDDTVSEQFRALFSQLQLVSKIDPPKTIVVTSTVPGEGKSFIASNLASVFVAHGRKVLLVDCDLRRPSQHRNYKLDNKAGMLRWLEEGGSIDGGELMTDPRLGIVEVTPGLFLLRTAGSSRKACELMDSGRLSALLQALQLKFDITILDTPPAGVFPDALAFARISQELIYICRFNTVSRQEARNVLQRLKQTGLDFPGIVLNAMPAGRTSSYYYYGYGYHARYYAKYYQEKKA